MGIEDLDLKLRIGYEYYLAIRDHSEELQVVSDSAHIILYLDNLEKVDNDGIRARIKSRLHPYEDKYVPSLKLLS